MSCRKRRYERREWAEQAMARLVAQTGYQPSLRVYWHQRCGCFHVGNQDPIWSAFGLIERERRLGLKQPSGGKL
jgi:hypothetical protein